MLHRYFFLALLFLAAGLNAQTCSYQLILQDTVRGDGWNGAQLTVRVAGVPTTYTLPGGRSESVFFTVTTGQTIELDFRRGAFPEETSFQLLDNNDDLLFEAASPETATTIFRATAACQTCAAPPLSSIDFFRVRFNSVDLRLRPNPAGDDARYLVEYSTGDFDPATDDGEEFTTTQALSRITGLDKETSYNFFVSTVCGSDTSARRGPFPVVTQKEIDLGITILDSPTTGCDAGTESLTVGITNYGGAPQQFFRLGYAINGEDVRIDYPFDGIFTGIVNVDSTEFFTFDNIPAISEPGRYQFEIYTLIEDDEDPSNDTLRIGITNQPAITDFPYVENFETSNGLWVTDRAGRGPISWAWGEPRNTLIDRAPQGSRAWVTGLFGNYFNGEESYLVSPCFDFSGMAEDPYFSCALVVDTEEDFDNLTLEMTTDGGENWRNVGISPADINWYNDRPDEVWDGNGGFGNGPRIVANLLEGAAGQTVQLRFVFTSSLDDTAEGVLIDAVTVGSREGIDVAALASSGGVQCPTASSVDIALSYTNLGTQPVDTIIISDPVGVTEAVTIIERLNPGNTRNYVFEGLALLPGDGSQNRRLIVSTPGDEQPANDTLSTQLAVVNELPFFEDFNDGDLPDFWSLEDGFLVATGSVDGSAAIVADATLATGTDLVFRTAYYGEIMENDTLKFSLDFAVLEQADTFNFKIRAVDCDVPLDSLSIENIISGEYAFPLSGSAGPGAFFEFILTPVSGSASASFDDINVARCPPALNLAVDVVPTTTQTTMNARATITPFSGTAPYTYDWSTGDNTQSVTGLALDDYTVTVTDRFGCTDVAEVIVRNFVGTDDPEGILQTLSASPNPTSGLVRLQLDLPELLIITTEVYDATGRLLTRQSHGDTRQLNATVDLSAFQSGLYLLRVRAGTAARSLRVLRK